MKAVQITTSSFAVGQEQLLDPIRRAGLEVRGNPYARRLTRDEIKEALDSDVVGLLAGLEPLDAEVLGGSSLRVISRVGSGVSNVDLDAARELGIEVRNTPDGPTTAVAELTVGALLALLREITTMNQALHQGAWDKRIGGEISGKTVAVVGLGRIGRRVAEMLDALGAEVLSVDPHVSENESTYTLLTLEEALPRADIVTVHTSGEATLIGRRELAAMRPGSYLLNAARGGVVDEAALGEALDSGHLAGAWLDAFVDEPYAGPFAGNPRVLLTPHAGSYTRECRLRMEGQAIKNLLDVLEGVAHS